MALETYAGLKSSVASWLNRADLTAVIPDFIVLFEARANREIRWRKMLQRDEIIAPSADESSENLPEDFLELKHIRWSESPNQRPPKYVTPTEMERLRALYDGNRGFPGHYTLVGTQIWFDRVPTEGSTVEITSYVKIPALSDANTSNSLLLEHPDIYLYGTLLQAEPYLKNDGRTTVWASLYGDAIDKLALEDARAEMGASPISMRLARSF